MKKLHKKNALWTVQNSGTPHEYPFTMPMRCLSHVTDSSYEGEESTMEKAEEPEKLGMRADMMEVLKTGTSCEK